MLPGIFVLCYRIEWVERSFQVEPKPKLNLAVPKLLISRIRGGGHLHVEFNEELSTSFLIPRLPAAEAVLN
jgi:hypothetical protein